jgi:hypothetical protein
MSLFVYRKIVVSESRLGEIEEWDLSFSTAVP